MLFSAFICVFASDRYTVQDFELTKAAAGVPGVPILYMYKNNVVLDKLSGATAKRVEDLSQVRSSVVFLLEVDRY